MMPHLTSLVPIISPYSQTSEHNLVPLYKVLKWLSNCLLISKHYLLKQITSPSRQGTISYSHIWNYKDTWCFGKEIRKTCSWKNHARNNVMGCFRDGVCMVQDSKHQIWLRKNTTLKRWFLHQIFYNTSFSLWQVLYSRCLGAFWI